MPVPPRTRQESVFSNCLLTVTSCQAAAVGRYTAARNDTQEADSQAGEQDVADHKEKGDGVSVFETPATGMLY
jgi:hypothetical protein